MKIIKQTTDELVTKDSGGSYVFGVLFLLIGIGGIYLYFKNGQPALVAIIVPAVFTIAAIFMILKKTTTIVDINKTTGKISFNRNSLIGSQSSEYDIANAQSIELRESSYTTTNTMNQPQGISFGNNYNTNRVLTHQTVLLMKDGTELPLESIKSSNNSSFSVMGVQTGVLMGGRGQMFAQSNAVAQFIGVPFNDIAGATN